VLLEFFVIWWLIICVITKKQSMRFLPGLLLIALFFSSCKTNSRLFGKKSARDIYESRLNESGISKTTLGNSWFSAASSALSQPISITLPYRQSGYFAADKPRAIGLKFRPARGEKIYISLTKKSSGSLILYMDLWKQENGKTPEMEEALDTAKMNFEFNADRDNESYILRLQPELLHSGSYEISISAGPSLAFPVPQKGKVGSLWGDARDAGARKHEGIDIFAPKKTPIVAVAEGRITRVEETSIGGKVIWLRLTDREFNIYYAHLDEQIAKVGDMVKAGEVIGTVGNTGNAQTTSPHLHFGIYSSGAIDPIRFVDGERRDAKTVSKSQLADQFIRVKNSKQYSDNTIGKATDINPRSALVLLADNTVKEIELEDLQPAIDAISNRKLKKESMLTDHPSIAGSPITSLKSGTGLRVLGYFNEYAFVEIDDQLGWIKRDELN
jgi:murein DD-endopeptidase MepM/ murein hydrolase activator NlpD